MARVYAIACVVVLALMLAGLPRAADPERLAAPMDAVPKMLGVASCAAMACHHGNGPRGSKGSEYSTWVAVDPHAKAYHVLYNDASKRMHEGLAKAGEAPKGIANAWENPRCLACHAMGADADCRIQADGVGCERCHGPAEKWKDTHYLNNFNRATPGFRDLRDRMTVRVEVCMDCHVGKGGQEVDHDLIALGHPRLRFDYAGFYASYPKHWVDTDRQRFGPDVEAQSWVLGQLIGAKSALRLLEARAVDEREAWPEFAEYDCAACHHGLVNDSFRQKRDLKKAEKKEIVKPGEIPWGTWYYSLLPTLPGDGAQKELNKVLVDLKKDMQRRVPSRGDVRAKSAAAAALIERWLASVCGNKYDAQQVRALMAKVAGQEGLLETGWDGAGEVYLALAALHQALGDIDPTLPRQGPLYQALVGMRKELGQAYQEYGRPLYDSPVKYNPKAEALLKGLELFRK